MVKGICLRLYGHIIQDNKRTECEPSQFVAAEGASHQPMQQMPHSKELSGQLAKQRPTFDSQQS